MDYRIDKLIENPHGVIYNGNSLFSISYSKLKKFVSVPWHISWYRQPESRKVFPIVLQEMMDLNPDYGHIKKYLPGSNPFFKHLEFLQYYIAYANDGKPLGRIASVIDKNYKEKKFEGKVGIISLFEAETKEVGESLIKAAIKDLSENNALKIIGPMRFNASGEAGLLIDGFDLTPMPMEPYNPPYYKDIFDSFGERENDWYSFLIDYKSVIGYVNKIKEFTVNGDSLEERLKKNGITVRTASLKDFKKEIERIKYVYNIAWDTVEHPQFEKFTNEEFDYIAASLKTIALEDIIFIAEEECKDCPAHNKDIIGVSVTIPNINTVIKRIDSTLFSEFMPSDSAISVSDLKRDIKIFLAINDSLKKKSFDSARIFILGTLKKRLGLDALLYEKTFDNGLALGMTYSSASQIADTNKQMVNPLLQMGKKGFTWRVYRFF
ncbi:MAG: hypothetical protein ACP5SB_01300 [Caldisericaceae bacterium]